jgi:hypothetical protein
MANGLLCNFLSFEGFRDMMITAAFYKEQLEGPSSAAPYVQSNHATPQRSRMAVRTSGPDMDDQTMQDFIEELSGMGFSDDMIDIVLSEANQNTSLQELVIQLTDMMVSCICYCILYTWGI